MSRIELVRRLIPLLGSWHRSEQLCLFRRTPFERNTRENRFIGKLVEIFIQEEKNRITIENATYDTSSNIRTQHMKKKPRKSADVTIHLLQQVIELDFDCVLLLVSSLFIVVRCIAFGE